MARFYGWTHDEIIQLPMSLFVLYLKNANRLEGEENLLLLAIETNPFLARDQRDLWERLQHQAQGLPAVEEYDHGQAFEQMRQAMLAAARARR